MKNLLLILSCFVVLVSCQKRQAKSNADYFGRYGDTTFLADGAINASELLDQMKGKDSIMVKFQAKINACCQKKGCWMNVDLGGDKEMRVKFKDYGFFVPFNSAGHNAIMEGKAFVDTVSVDELRHLAKDEGLTQSEIDAITSPEVEYTFVASGVIIE